MRKILARTFLAAAGWTFTNEVPGDVRKFVLVGAPHTSNWDFPFVLAVAALTDQELFWVGKHTLFTGPAGPLMRALGGISVDRRARRNYVSQLAEAFDARETMALAVAAEGTRSRAEHWRSGFYHIAREAGVPIVLGYLDWGKKRVGFGEVLDPNALSKEEVLEAMKRFYADVQGKHPENFSQPSFRAEGQEHA